MDKKDPFEISQGFSIIQPNPDRAYPIPCTEWNYLKNKIGKISEKINVYHTLGSILLGAAASTIIALVSGGFPKTEEGEVSSQIIIAWACVVVCLICGGVCMLFAFEKRKVSDVKSSDVISHMEVIEQRFENSGLEQKSGENDVRPKT